MTVSLFFIEGIAAHAHLGQTRKFNGEPYIEHPRRVAQAASGDAERLDLDYWAAYAVGLLHDVLEDTQTTATDLVDLGVPVDVVASVEVLTRRSDETHAEYIRRVLLSGDQVAYWVKLADINDNLRDLPPSHGLARRYRKSLEILSETA